MRLGYATAFLAPLIIDRMVKDADDLAHNICGLGCYYTVVLVGAYMCYTSFLWMT